MNFSSDLDRFLSEVVDPVASALDSDPAVARRVIDQMRAAGLLEHQLARALGVDDPPTFAWRYFHRVARHSGALAFLVKQNSVAVAYLAGAGPLPPRLAELRSALEAGGATMGISFSCAEVGPGDEVVRAVPAPGGWSLAGPLRWASGLGVFDALLIDLLVEDRIHLAPIPFGPASGVWFGEPARLCGLNASATVFGRLDGLVLPIDGLVGPYDAHVLLSKPTTYVTHCMMLLGAARGALDVGRTASGRPEDEGPKSRAFEHHLVSLGERVEGLVRDGPALTLDQALTTKIEVAELAARCVHFASSAVGAKAASAAHPLSRVRGEVALLSLQGNHPLSRSVLYARDR